MNRVVADNGNYYPFGTAFAETPIAEQGKQPYKFNGKELDPMHGLNWYDYSARHKDDFRFTTMDPLAEKYPWISPYAYCANNPVNRVDRDGREWKTTQDEEYARKLSTEMTNKKDAEFAQAVNKFGDYKIALSKGDTEGAAKIAADMKEMGKNISNLEAGVSELTAMGDTKDQVFTYNKTGGDVGNAKIENGVVVMNIAGNGNVTNGIHESSHRYDLWKGGGMPTSTSAFYSTETKAYGRQFSFGGKSAMPYSEWGSVNSLGNVTTNWVVGITDSKGDYMYPKQLLGDKYNKAQVRAILFSK